MGLIIGLEKNDQSKIDIDDRSNFQDGTYLRLVYIGSSKCFYSNNPDTHHMIKAIKTNLESKLKKESIHFISTGLAYDYSHITAFDYLNKSGPYDELLVGGGSFNIGVIHYVSGSSPTPMLLLFKEVYNTQPVGLNLSNFLDSQHLLKAYTGQFEIKELHELIDSSTPNDVIKCLGI